jgi:hypothetical protein
MNGVRGFARELSTKREYISPVPSISHTSLRTPSILLTVDMDRQNPPPPYASHASTKAPDTAILENDTSLNVCSLSMGAHIIQQTHLRNQAIQHSTQNPPPAYPSTPRPVSDTARVENTTPQHANRFTTARRTMHQIYSRVELPSLILHIRHFRHLNPGFCPGAYSYRRSSAQQSAFPTRYLHCGLTLNTCCVSADSAASSDCFRLTTRFALQFHVPTKTNDGSDRRSCVTCWEYGGLWVEQIGLDAWGVHMRVHFDEEG